MSIASYKPDRDPPVVTPNLPKVEPDSYKSIIYDDKNKPLHSLIAYIEGAPWPVDYFSQVVGEHNDLREVDPGQANVYQQYQKINKLELRTSDPLTSSYDTDTGLTEVTGSALIYPFVTPNISDYFTSGVADSKVGLFRITNVERKTLNRDSVYFVEYSMVGYIDALETLYNDLVDKVIRTYFFSKDRLVEGLQPLLRNEENEQLVNLDHLYKDLVRYYFNTFFNRKFMTLVIPGQEYPIYDSYVVNYLFKIIDSFDAEEIKLIKQIPTDQDIFLNQPQFWEIMLRRDYDGLKQANQKMAQVSKYLFNCNSYLRGLIYSNIEYLIYPRNPELSTLIDEYPVAKQLEDIDLVLEVVTANGSLADMIDNTFVDVNASYPYINMVNTDDFYVLSSEFYTSGSSLSLLEILTKDYLKRQTIDLTKLLSLVEKFKSWGRLEQYYYGPILMTLIKEANRSTYS